MKTPKLDNLLIPPPTRTQLKSLQAPYQKLATTVFLNALADINGGMGSARRTEALQFLLADPDGQRDIDIIFRHWYNYLSESLSIAQIRRKVRTLRQTKTRISRNLTIAQLKRVLTAESPARE